MDLLCHCTRPIKSLKKKKSWSIFKTRVPFYILYNAYVLTPHMVSNAKVDPKVGIKLSVPYFQMHMDHVFCCI